MEKEISKIKFKYLTINAMNFNYMLNTHVVFLMDNKFHN